MNYRVLWSPQAEWSMEQLLRNSPDGELLAGAARAIDQFLFADPKSFGESRYDAVRIGFVRPLGIQFEVMDDVRTVIVYGVWRFAGP